MFLSIVEKPYSYVWMTPKADPEASVDIDLPDGKEIILSIDKISATTYAANFTVDNIDWEDSLDEVSGMYYNQLMLTLLASIVDWKNSVATSTLLYFTVQKATPKVQESFARYLAMRIAKVTSGSLSVVESTKAHTLRINW